MRTFTPGIYNISNDEYHAANGISRSALMLFKKSPLHYANQYENDSFIEKEQTPALILGQALHVYILENDKFNSMYFIADKPNQTTKIGKEQWIEIQKEAGDKIILNTKMFEEIKNMGDSFLSNDIACEFLKNAKIEQSIFWKDSSTNTMLKCKPDIWLPNIIADIKTTRDASVKAFQRDMAEYGYHIQGAMIHDGIYHATKERVTEFVMLAIEKEPPYAVGIYMLDHDSLKRGQDEYRALVNEYNQYKEKKVWPGYKPTTISLPAYYI